MMNTLTSQTFEYIWKDRTSRIAHVYKIVLSGCRHESIVKFVMLKDSFLYAGHGLRSELLRGGEITGDRAMLFNIVDGELEEAWDDIPVSVKRMV